MVLCVVIESRQVPGHHLALPVWSRLYLNKAAAQKWNRAYRKQSEPMLELLHILERHTSGSGKCLHLLGDSAFTAPDLLS